MGKKILFISGLFSATLIICALHYEQRYLLLTNLLYVSSGTASFLHFLMFFTLLFYFTTFFTFALETPYTKYIFLGNFSLLLLLQILCFIYGGSSIDSSIETFRKEWGKTGENSVIEKAEKTLECCGFYDVLESFTSQCPYTTTCSTYILDVVMYRKLRFLAFISVSFVFQVYHAYSLFNLLTFESDQPILDSDI